MIRKAGAAVRGRSVATDGAANAARAKAPKSETMRGSIRSEGPRQAPPQGVNPGVQSNAGLNNGKSAYVQNNGAGYQRRPQPSLEASHRPVPAFNPGTPEGIRVSNYRNSSYNGLTIDRDLSSLL